MLNQIRTILIILVITTLLIGSGLPFGEQPAFAAEREELDLPPLELPEKGNPKLDSQLNQLVSAETPQKVASLAMGSNIDLVDGKVRVIIECLPGEVDSVIKAVGELGNLETSYRNLLQMTVPIARLTALAGSPSIRLVRLPWEPLPAIVSEGVALINADDWQTASYNGTGVKVAILDVGFDGYTTRQSEGELPTTITTWWAPSINGTGTSAHGTACAEIVYDIAPDAEFYLANFDTSVEMGNAVDWLITQGVDIISCSIVWPIGGPGDGTGPICEMVDDARAAGILWSQAIGNSAQRHWQGYFVNNDGDPFHEFAGFDETNDINVTSGDPIICTLKWDDTWGSSGNDYDLLLYDDSYTLVWGSANIQDGDDYPLEGFFYTATYTGTYHISIGTLGSPAVVNFHLYSYNHYLEYQVAASSLCVPADSPNAVAVGAVPWDNPTTLEPFSSRGPTKDGRKKPDLVAPDGVTSATYDPDPFFGTSASAPHVAGAAALVKERYPSYGLSQIQSFLEERAVDLGTAGKDNLYGSGRLDLGSAGIIVTTISADNITSTSATLNGKLDYLGYSLANVSFKWGTKSGALDQETTPEEMTSTGAFSADLSNLEPGTTYYFKAKATGSETVYGDELSFTTLWYPETVLLNAVIIAPGTDIIDLAVNGDTIYAVIQDTISKKLYKSTDAGATWADLSSTTDYPSANVTMVAVSPDDADILVIATADHYIYFSFDSGESWDSLSRPAPNFTINDIDISGLTGGRYYVAAGGIDGSGNAELYTFKLAMAESWVAQYNSITDNATPNQDLIKAVKFSPNFQIDRIIGVVSASSSNVTFQCFHYEEGAEAWNGAIPYFGAGWGTGITTGNITALLTSASIAFHPSYDGTVSPTRIVFIGWADATSVGDLSRLTNTSLKSIETWDGGPVGPIHNLAYHHLKSLLAGDYDANKVYVCYNTTSATPKCEQTSTIKQPGGENRTLVGWSGNTAVAATSGDESAFSVSITDGYSFNDISLIDTELDVISDFAINADGNKLYLTTHDISEGSGNYDVSVWVNTSSWQRVFGQRNVSDTSARYLVRIAPENDLVVYISANGTNNMWVSASSGMATWKSITFYKLDFIQDFVVESANTTYAIDAAGCSKTTDAGSSWEDRKSLDGVIGYMITLAPNNDVLVGGSDGYVAFSKDGGVTFIRTKVVKAGEKVQVAADKDYASNNIIYTGAGTEVYRGAADNTTAFVNRGPTIDTTHTIVGAAQYMHVIYALSSNSTHNTLHRALNLKTAETSALALWSSRTTPHTFNATPQALKLSSGPKLWAIDTNKSRLYSCIDIIEPDVTIQPSFKNFGSVLVGSSSAAQKVTITNDGTADLNIGIISIDGTHKTDFSIKNDGASGQTLTPYTSASLKVTFNPSSAGSKSATLNIPSDDPDEPLVTASLSGKGTSPPSGGGGGGGGGGGAPKPGIISLSDYIRSNGILLGDVTGKSEDKKCMLTLKKGTKCLTEYDIALKRITIFEAEEPHSPPEGCSFIGLVYDIGPDGAKFEPSITLSISYDPEALQNDIAEDGLYIAYWDGSQWSALESKVDMVDNIVSVEISHFTQFAIIGKPSPPPPPPPPPPPKPTVTKEPANFVISDLSVTPSGVKPGKQVTISVTVTNTGGTEGSYTVVLYINGVEESRTEVTLEAGMDETVTFTVVGATEGSNTIDINGEAGTFTVIVPPPKTITPEETTSVQLKTKWWLIGGIIVGFVIIAVLLLYFLVWRKRGASRPAQA